MTNIEIVLTGKGGELDRQKIQWDEVSDSELSQDIHEAIKAWVLAPGDIISIAYEGYE